MTIFLNCDTNKNCFLLLGSRIYILAHILLTQHFNKPLNDFHSNPIRHKLIFLILPLCILMITLPANRLSMTRHISVKKIQKSLGATYIIIFCTIGLREQSLQISPLFFLIISKMQLQNPIKATLIVT